jgi:hypothetical protein
MSEKIMTLGCSSGFQDDFCWRGMKVSCQNVLTPILLQFLAIYMVFFATSPFYAHL